MIEANASELVYVLWISLKISALQGFAALMVCGETDAASTLVKGVASRISMPYPDPKIHECCTYEALKYAERRDDIGRLTLGVMMQVRNRLNQ